ncbi:MAG: aldo/keto reductase [Chitinivibrionales bacterium]|nr:aldo/keto reductase [Chitinivibrionales bacterium]
MQYCSFGKTGLRVSQLGIGAIGIRSDVDMPEAARLTQNMLDLGCNLIDTAQCYTYSEEMIGKFLAHRRQDFILVTKCGHHRKNADGSQRSLPVSMIDIDQALTRLRTDHLDAMLLHSYDYDLLLEGEGLNVLLCAKRAGKIRFIGYSGDNERAEWCAKQPEFDILEMSINLFDQNNITSALPEARRTEKGVIAKKPIANAAWRCLDNPGKAGEHWRKYLPRIRKMAVDPDDYGCRDMSELALRFTLSVAGVNTAIVSSRNAHHQQANVKAVESGALPERHLAELHNRFAQARGSSQWPALN